MQIARNRLDTEQRLASRCRVRSERRLLRGANSWKRSDRVVGLAPIRPDDSPGTYPPGAGYVSLLVIRALALGVLGATLVPAPADAGDTLLRPGRGMAGVELGMTRAQVVKVLGKPAAQLEQRLGFGRRTLQLQYRLAAYVVELSGPDGRERVVKIRTHLNEERTREGIRVGIPEKRLLAVYGQQLDCQNLTYRDRFSGRTRKRTWRYCVLGAKDEPQTVFRSQTPLIPWGYGAREENWELARIAEIIVRAPAAAPEPGESES